MTTKQVETKIITNKDHYDYFTHHYKPDDSMYVGWGDAHKQLRCFSSLLRIVEYTNSTLLDVGCGVGDLNIILNGLNKDVLYTGIDNHPKMIDAARKRYADKSFVFDSLKDHKKRYDYVVACGVFNLRTRDQMTDLYVAVKKMAELAKHGVALNLLSSTGATYQAPELYYYDPAETLVYLTRSGFKADIRHDYAIDDFTIYIRK